MGKRTATIAVLLALTFLGSLLALAVVGGVRTVRVTPALGPADPLLPDVEGSPVDAAQGDPAPSRTPPAREQRPSSSDDAAVPRPGSPPGPSGDSAIEPTGDQVTVEPPPVGPPTVVPPIVVPPTVAPPEVTVPPALGSTEAVDAVGSAAKNGSEGKGASKGEVKEKTQPPKKKKNGSNGKGSNQSSHQNGVTNGSSGHADQPSDEDDDDEDDDDGGHGSDGD